LKEEIDVNHNKENLTFTETGNTIEIKSNKRL